MIVDVSFKFLSKYCLSCEQFDRFIPNRSAMDFDYARTMLTGRKGKENAAAACSPEKNAYQRRLAEVFNMNGRRILAFKNKPPVPIDLFADKMVMSFHHSKPIKPHRQIPQVCYFCSLYNKLCLKLETISSGPFKNQQMCV